MLIIINISEILNALSSVNVNMTYFVRQASPEDHKESIVDFYDFRSTLP
jgi:hypothetical protein